MQELQEDQTKLDLKNEVNLQGQITEYCCNWQLLYYVASIHI